MVNRCFILHGVAITLSCLVLSTCETAIAESKVRISRLWTEEADDVPSVSEESLDPLSEEANVMPPIPSVTTASSSSVFDEALNSHEGDHAQQGCCGNSCCSNGCCGNGCCQGSSCGGCGGCNGCDKRLLGLFGRTDPCFRNFISPLTNPLFFEDPRTLTEARVIYASHWIPNSNPVFGGGNAQYVATQLRGALTKRLSLIATKDGYLWIDPKAPGVANVDGWANLALGLKYNLIRDPEAQRIWSAGFTYQAPTGTTRVFQGLAGGEFHAFLTGGRQILDRGHWITGAGYRVATTSELTDMVYWSNHWDYEFIPTLYGLFEINWFHWTRSGTRLPIDFEGNDLLNLGANNVAGNNIVTMGVGGRKRFGRILKHELGAGYEMPLTTRRDIFNNRLYVDLLLRY